MTSRIPFDSLTLRAAAGEIAAAIVHGQVQRIVQPSPTDLLIGVRAPGATHGLLLSCDARFARACLTNVRRPVPPTPPAFCMLCRKYLEGGEVISVAQRGFDRILDIRVEGPEGPVILVAEFMGKHSNLLLLSPGGVILDAAKRVTRQQSRFRETLPGRTYAAPPAQEDRLDPIGDREAVIGVLSAMPEDEEAAAAGLMARIAGMSPFLARELTLRRAKAPAEDVWSAVFGAAGRGAWTPVLIRGDSGEPAGAYPLATVQTVPGAQHARASVSDAVDHAFTSIEARANLDQAVSETRGLVARALAARRRQARETGSALEQAGRALDIRRQGELILAFQAQIEPGAQHITVPNLYGGGTDIVIALDPTQTPAENAEARFRRYHKLRSGVEALRTQHERAVREEAALADALAKLDAAADPEAVRSLRRELTAEGLLRAASAHAETGAAGPDHAAYEGKKIRTVHTPDGWEILVGENSQANDYLTTRVAAPNDIWLHVRANTSAHVVIRTHNAPDRVPAGVIEEAARLAAQHSAAKHSSVVPVDWTLRKYVRRPRGAASGTVQYRGERTVYVDPRR